MMGDGTMAGIGGTSGIRGVPFWLMSRLAARLQPAPMPVLAQSGSTIARQDGSNMPFIVPVAVPAASAQYPDVLILLSVGANDNVLSRDPAATPWLQDWKDAVSLMIASNPQALLFVITGTAPSLKAGETTYRSGVWAQQSAFVAGLNNPKCVFVDVSSIDPNSWSPSSDTLRVHPDERGAQQFADLVFAAMSPRLAATSQQDVLDMIFAGAYPGQSAQIDTDHALVGTGGTVTNMTGGSTAPTSKLATNLTGSTSVAAAAVATTAGRQKLSVTLGGTVTTENKVMLQDRLNLTVTGATPGQFALTGMMVRASAGFVNAGADFGTFASSGGGASSLAASAGVFGPVVNPVDSIWMIFPQPLWSATFATKRSVAFRYPVGALSGTIEIEQPFAWVPSMRARGSPAYLGGYTFNGVSLAGTNYRLRVTGTIAAGFRFEPGYWCSPSASMRQISGLHEGRNPGSS
ncbi:MAG: SGNH/GDSL hydrolase family protein [Beijerinckiaceae bacterium]